MRTALCVASLLCALCAHGFAEQRPIPRNSTVFVEEMENDLDGYLRAEFIKKKVPLRLVLNSEEADLILTGTSTEEEKRKWHEGWLTTERDKTSGNVMLVDMQARQILWASEAGDRSLWWGSLARGGHRKIAARLVNKLKKAIRKQ